MSLAYIPSPAQGEWHWFGFIPIRAYAICILIGVVVAIIIGEKRWRDRGGQPGTILDLAIWAVPFGLVGGRIYHVITDWQIYFGPTADKTPLDTLIIWEGGLGIWGAVALGGVGVWWGCHRRGIRLRDVADAVAPGIVVGQAIGRFGNWFNQELYGAPLDAFWALEIDPAHRLAEYRDVATYHPTFLYEAIWDVGVALLVIWAAKRYGLRNGRAFALYVAAYTVGRFWIEALRIDPANEVAGFRINNWVSVVVFLGAVAYLWFMREDRMAVPEATTGGGESGEPAPEEATTADKADQADRREDAGEREDADGPDAEQEEEDEAAEGAPDTDEAEAASGNASEENASEEDAAEISEEDAPEERAGTS